MHLFFYWWQRMHKNYILKADKEVKGNSGVIQRFEVSMEIATVLP
jgi:hypothetical protein